MVINDRAWAQPSSGFYVAADMMSATNLAAKAIYVTSKNSDNDQKVLIIYGVRLVRTGPARTISRLLSSAITFRRGQVKTIECDSESCNTLIYLANRNVGHYTRPGGLRENATFVQLYCSNCYNQYQKSDNARIEFHLKASGYYWTDIPVGASGATSAVNVAGGVSGAREHLMLLGKVIEKIGDQVTG